MRARPVAEPSRWVLCVIDRGAPNGASAPEGNVMKAIHETGGEAAEDCTCGACRRRRGCFINRDSDALLPAGWCEVQRDDSPDYEAHLVHFFEGGDVEAGVWISAAVRAVSVETGETTALVQRDRELVVPAGWCPGHRVRVIVPILDAIDRGLLELGELL